MQLDLATLLDLADLGRSGWSGGLATTYDIDEFADDGLVAVVPGWSRGFVETKALAEASAVGSTDFLQDAVVDDAGFGWPELSRDGVSSGRSPRSISMAAVVGARRRPDRARRGTRRPGV